MVVSTYFLISNLPVFVNEVRTVGIVLSEAQVATGNLHTILALALNNPCNIIFDVNTLTDLQLLQAGKTSYMYHIDILDCFKIVNHIYVNNSAAFASARIDAYVGDEALRSIFGVTQAQLDSDGFATNLCQTLLLYDAKFTSIIPGTDVFHQTAFVEKVTNLHQSIVGQPNIDPLVDRLERLGQN